MFSQRLSEKKVKKKQEDFRRMCLLGVVCIPSLLGQPPANSDLVLEQIYTSYIRLPVINTGTILRFLFLFCTFGRSLKVQIHYTTASKKLLLLRCGICFSSEQCGVTAVVSM